MQATEGKTSSLASRTGTLQAEVKELKQALDTMQSLVSEILQVQCHSLLPQSLAVAAYCCHQYRASQGSEHCADPVSQIFEVQHHTLLPLLWLSAVAFQAL